MRPLTYSLQFRGQADQLEGGLRKEARAPGGALVTSLTPDGVAGGFVWAPGDEEAYFESALSFTDDESFDGRGTIVFSRGHALYVPVVVSSRRVPTRTSVRGPSSGRSRAAKASSRAQAGASPRTSSSATPAT